MADAFGALKKNIFACEIANDLGKHHGSLCARAHLPPWEPEIEICDGFLATGLRSLQQTLLVIRVTRWVPSEEKHFVELSKQAKDSKQKIASKTSESKLAAKIEHLGAGLLLAIAKAKRGN